MKKILITGAAGFIGFHLSKILCEKECTVVGFDNLNDYYDIQLKQMRLDILNKYSNFTFIKGDISNTGEVAELFSKHDFDVVVNLAAQAGVRYSISNPKAYIDSNIIGFFNILEECRKTIENAVYPVKHLIYASSSSVYGENKKIPYSVDDKVDQPVSLYAATKKSNELMAYSYSKLYSIPCTGLRFFTVYGPFGRPDMAYFKFSDKMVNGDKIQIYNNGDMYRDFTYIDDIILGITKVIDYIPLPDDIGVCHKIYNIGNSSPEKLVDFVDTLESSLMEEGIISRSAIKEFLPMQPGDVYQTYADVSDLQRDLGFCPKTTLKEGLHEFAKWYKTYRITK